MSRFTFSFSLICVGGYHSVVAWCIGDIPNSCSCGIVWFVDIPSVYCRSCLPNELGVRDWNWLFGVLAVSSSTFSFFFQPMRCFWNKEGMAFACLCSGC